MRRGLLAVVIGSLATTLGCSSGSHLGPTTGPTTSPSPASVPASQLSFIDPIDIAFTGGDGFWVADYRADSISRVRPTGAHSLELVGQPLQDLGGPNRLAVAPDGRLWAAMWDANELVAYDVSGSRLTERIRLTAPGMAEPTGLNFDAQGWLWVTNQVSGKLLGFPPAQLHSGRVQPRQTVALPGGSAAIPEDVVFDRDGAAWVVEYDGDVALRYPRTDLVATDLHVAPLRTKLHGFKPIGLEVSPNGEVWAAGADGKLGQLAGGELTPFTPVGATAPHSMTWDGKGNVWITDPTLFVAAYSAKAFGAAHNAKVVFRFIA